jgi:PAS domain S-box-containing protein
MREVVGETVRVLLASRDVEFRSAVRGRLEADAVDIALTTVTDGDEAVESVERETVDCVVSGDDVAGATRLGLLETLQARWPDLPVILCPVDGSERLAGEAVAAGAAGYLQRRRATEPGVLAERVREAVDRRRGREARAASEPAFERLVENLPGLVYRCHNERGWPMEYVSGRCADLTGYTPAEIESGDVLWGEDILYGDDRERAWRDVQDAIANGDPFQITYRIERRDGEIRWVWERGRGVFEDGDLVALEGFITDVTSRRHGAETPGGKDGFGERALDALEDIFFVIDPDDETLIRWNERLAAIAGHDDAAIERMTAVDFLAEADHDRVRAAIGEAIKSGAATVTADVVTDDGDHVPYEFRGTPLYEAGELVGIGGVGRDITDRLEREQELEQYRTLVENVGDPMYILDADGEIEMVNSALAEALGYERSAIEGAPVTEFMPPEYIERGAEVLMDIVNSDDETGRWEMEAIRADGTRVLAENMTGVITDADGEFVGSVGTIRDITERKRRERELERYETVVEAVGDPVYALDEDGQFTFVNEAIEEMTGYDADELIGEHIGRVLPDEDVARGREHVLDLLADDERRAVKFEIDVRTADGRTVRSELHMALLSDEEGQFRGTAGIVRDITERKQRERRLEEFASVVSHDLRNPLNVIMGRIGLARETGDPEHFEEMATATERMQTLIEDLLTLARQGEAVSDVSTVDLRNVVTNAWQSVDADRATLDVTGETTLDADPDRLCELLENLFRNAVEHGTAEGGNGVAVSVGTLADEDGFFVADDGPGIPADEREQVFERGYSTAERGTGFGLSIVERIADAHGWTVELAESDAGGARFEFRV